MGAAFGPFLLDYIRSDAVATEEQCLDILDQYARMGFCGRFCEVIGERVVEFHDGVGAPEAAHLYRWLEGAEAERVLSLRGMGGSYPYSYFAFLDGLASLYTPDEFAERGSAELALSTGDTYRFTAMPAPQAIAALARINERLQGETPDFWNGYDLSRRTTSSFTTCWRERWRAASRLGCCTYSAIESTLLPPGKLRIIRNHKKINVIGRCKFGTTRSQLSRRSIVYR